MDTKDGAQEKTKEVIQESERIGGTIQEGARKNTEMIRENARAKTIRKSIADSLIPIGVIFRRRFVWIIIRIKLFCCQLNKVTV
jgi:hypothetical protein